MALLGEIQTRLDIGYEQTQLGLLLAYNDKEFDKETIEDLRSIMLIWDRINTRLMERTS